MAKEQVEKKVIYSETIDLGGTEQAAKNQAKVVSELEEENKVIRSTLGRLEEESSMLRELFNNTNTELNNLKKPALLVGDTVSVLADKAIVKLPNGNKFYCYIAKEVKDLRSGDTVLIDQKSLNVVEKIDVGNSL